MAYVSVSRGRYDAEIYTNDKGELAHDLSRDVSQRTATEYEHQPGEPGHSHEAGHEISAVSEVHEHGAEQSHGESVGEGHGQGIGE
jgi:hypothetical protein